MNRHMNIVVDNIADYEEELKKIFEASTNSTTSIAYYFKDRDTNPLKNVFVAKIDCNQVTPYHKHDFYEINYVMSGILHEIISGKSFTLTAGTS